MFVKRDTTLDWCMKKHQDIILTFVQDCVVTPQEETQFRVEHSMNFISILIQRFKEQPKLVNILYCMMRSGLKCLSWNYWLIGHVICMRDAIGVYHWQLLLIMLIGHQNEPSAWLQLVQMNPNYIKSHRLGHNRIDSPRCSLFEVKWNVNLVKRREGNKRKKILVLILIIIKL